MAKNRREALKQGFALLGAAVGIGVARKSLAASPDTPSDARQSKLVHARGLRISSQDLRRGELPPAGIRMLARAEIVADASGKQKVGDFFASYFQINPPGKVAEHEPGSIEQHTFVFPEGTILGSGVAPSGRESEGQFAIIGGTGRYLGARGSYTARQSHLEFGGNGTAIFNLKRISQARRHHWRVARRDSSAKLQLGSFQFQLHRNVRQRCGRRQSLFSGFLVHLRRGQAIAAALSFRGGRITHRKRHADHHRQSRAHHHQVQ
jgi:hypothetical protein